MAGTPESLRSPGPQTPTAGPAQRPPQSPVKEVQPQRVTAQPSLPALAESTGVLRGPQKAVTRMGEEGWGPLRSGGAREEAGDLITYPQLLFPYFPALQPKQSYFL